MVGPVELKRSSSVGVAAFAAETLTTAGVPLCPKMDGPTMSPPVLFEYSAAWRKPPMKIIFTRGFSAGTPSLVSRTITKS